MDSRGRLCAGVLALLGFAAVGWLVHDRVPAIDLTLGAAVRGWRSPLTVALAHAVSRVLAPLLTDVCFGALLLAGVVAAVRGLRTAATELFRLAVLLGLTWFGTDLAKYVVLRPRPPRAQWLEDVSSNPSWPSGHTAAVSALALTVLVVVARYARRWLPAAATLAVLAVLLVAWSRILLGVHYVTDVGASVLGALGLNLVLGVLLFPAPVDGAGQRVSGEA